MDAEDIVELSSSNDDEETQNNTYSEPMVTQDPVNGELVIDIDTDKLPASASASTSTSNSTPSVITSTIGDEVTTESLPRMKTYSLPPTSLGNTVRPMVLSSGMRAIPLSIALAKSSGPTIRLQSQSQIMLAPKQTKPTFGVTGQERELSLQNFEEFNCHGIPVFIQKSAGISVYMACPVCKVMCPKSTLSWHLQRAHEVAYIACSGIHCVNFRCKIEEYSDHISQEHSIAFCEVCEVEFEVENYAQHVIRQDLHARTDTILMPKALQTKLNLRPPLSMTNAVTAQLNMEYVNINFRSQPRSAAILLNGDIVLIDGIKYLIKDYIPFVECPICEKLVAIHVLGVHVKMDHETETIRCPAQVCRIRLKTDVCLTHFLSEHGAYTCKSCLRLVFLHEVKTHVKSKCQAIPQTRAVPKALTVNRWAGKNEYNKVMVKCEYCLIDISETRYRLHLQKYHRPRITCGVCQEVYQRNEFWAHIQSDHKGQTSVGEGCLICGESVAKMRTHLRVEHDLSLEAARIVTKNFYGASAKTLSIPLSRVDDWEKHE